MNNIDKISRDVKILLDSAKDATVKNVMNEVTSGKLPLSHDQLNQLVSLLNLSIDEGYMRALPTFQNSVKKYTEVK